MRVCEGIPVVLCANKIDVKERKVKSKSITYPMKFNIGFFEISVKSRICLKEPLEYLLQHLTKELDLKIGASLDAAVFELSVKAREVPAVAVSLDSIKTLSLEDVYVAQWRCSFINPTV
ncbi:uncharacterized protein [Macrobrachium rosenbergii]|uniref:uncharacterized protein n=1 Tax=Macrobrachium rosenbergii TaxID=79674 RepID=UPI0034D52308